MRRGSAQARSAASPSPVPCARREYLPAGAGVVYVASDKKHVAEDMVDMLGSLDGGAYTVG